MKKETCFCFDLDGTVTQEELLPLIASEVGLEEEIALLTRLTMDGLIPFESSFRLRFALLRSTHINRIQSIVDTVKIDPHVHKFINANSDRCFIVTGNLDVWISALVKRLGCVFFSSTTEVSPDNQLRISNIMRKSVPLLLLKERFDRVVAIGDGYNDLPMFDVADITIAFNGVHPSPDALVSASDYVVMEGESLCRLLNTL